MADTKFSQFTLEETPGEGVFIVGYIAGVNVRIPIAALLSAFIPLSGTEVGKPVTGDVEFTGDRTIYNKTGDIISEAQIGNGYFVLTIRDNDIGNNLATVSLSIDGTISVDSDIPSSVGLVSPRDFSTNYNTNSYIQRIYLDRVADSLRNEMAAGGNTKYLVSGSGIDVDSSGAVYTPKIADSTMANLATRFAAKENTLTAGTNITIDRTDPLNPVVSSTGGGSSVTSYGKNATLDSTILLLSDGTRYAAKDSVGSGGGGGSDTLKVSVSDTAAMLAPYVNQNTNRAAYTLFGNRTASIAQPNFFLNPYIDSIKVSTDTIFGRVNGSWIYQQKTPAFANWLTSGSNIYTTAVQVQHTTTSTAIPNDTKGIQLLNSNAASSGVNQYPDALTFKGNAWRTDNSTSVPMSIGWRLKPAQHGNPGSSVQGSLEMFGNYNGINIPNIMNVSLKANGYADVWFGGVPYYQNSFGVKMSAALSAEGVKTPFVGFGDTKHFLWTASLPAGSADFLIGRAYAVSSIFNNWATPIPFTVGSMVKPDNSALVDMQSTTAGVLPPRMTTTQKNAIASPANALQVYDADTKQPQYYDGVSWKAQVGMIFGTAAPVITPSAVGNFYLDTTNKKLYVSAATTSSSDWIILN